MDKIIMDQLMKSGALIWDGMGQLPQDFDKSDRNERLLIKGMDKAAVEEALKSYTCTGALIQCGMGQLPQDLEPLIDLKIKSSRSRAKKDAKIALLQGQNAQMEQVIASLQKEREKSKAKELTNADLQEIAQICVTQVGPRIKALQKEAKQMFLGGIFLGFLAALCLTVLLR